MAKRKHPRTVTWRDIPKSPKALEEMIRALTRKMKKRAAHIKREPHDYRNRAGLKALYNQRSKAFVQLIEVDEELAVLLAEELNLKYKEEA